ncbi:MAG: hypothetical protein RLY31_2197 [Bacteroidota bacterium]|jgi:type IX secretion system PorP/SprF family membrane protein
MNQYRTGIGKRLFLWLAWWVGTTGALHAQDPVFSQFHTMPLTFNPAFAGTTYAPRFGVAYRNEWPTVTGAGTAAYKTFAASWDQFVPSLNSGFGALFIGDDAGGGLLRTNVFAANYAYKIDVTDHLHVRIGVNAGFRQTVLNWDALIFYDQLDPVSGPIDPAGNPNPTNELRPDNLNKTLFDVGTGLLLYSNRFYGGISLQHLTTPEEGFLQNTSVDLTEGLPLRTSLHAGAEFVVRQGNKRRPSSFFSPSAIFVRQANQGQLNLGAYYNHGLVFVGSWYRHAFGNPDAVIVLMGFQYEFLKIGYSYDYTVSGLSASGGSHELSVVFNLDNSQELKRKRYAQRYNDCFGIFR